MLTENWSGLTVLYLCPLRALLNNLHVRLDGYSQLVGRRVGLWHGDISDGARHPDQVLMLSPNGVDRAVLLAGRTWKVNHIDWKRRVAHVEPVMAAGVAQWQGVGAGLSQTLARSARTVLAGADPAGVTMSQRAVAHLAELRHEFKWTRETMRRPSTHPVRLVGLLQTRSDEPAGFGGTRTTTPSSGRSPW